jgi:hypothetical protein
MTTEEEDRRRRKSQPINTVLCSIESRHLAW